MADEREVVVAGSAEDLATRVADRFVDAVSAVIAERGRAAVALTAGSIMEKVWSALASSGASLDWSSVDVFWGDERFVPKGSSERNDVPAEKLLFASAPFSAATRYSMPSSDGEFGDDLDAAAAGYVRTLAEHAARGIDLVLLGVGPDGHCCSLFPDHPSSRDLSAAVIPVRNPPKPPPLRMSLSFDGLNAARQVWAVVSGSGKADAVAEALAEGASREHVPSAGARGTDATIWFVDSDAAANLRT